LWVNPAGNSINSPSKAMAGGDYALDREQQGKVSGKRGCCLNECFSFRGKPVAALLHLGDS